MKKSEFRKLIREEVKSILKEGADWIVLDSIHSLIDSYTLAIYPMVNGKINIHVEVEPGTKDYNMLIKKLDSKDRKIYTSVKKEAGK